MKLIVFASLLATAYGVGDSLNNAAPGQDLMAQLAGNWANGQCTTGTNQSPININTLTAIRPIVDPGVLNFAGFNQNQPYGIFNDGNTITLSRTGPGGTPTFVPMVSGGPLQGIGYAFSHAEFHWGTTNVVGSEHSVNGIFAPLEMQVVLHKTVVANAAVPTLQAAVQASLNVGGTFDPQAVVVLNFQFQIGTTANAALAPIIAGAPIAGGAGRPTGNVNLMTLMSGGLNLADYYYYDGSLTLPQDATANADCLETVRWIHFTFPLSVSAAQMVAIRALATGPVQQNALTPSSNSRNIQNGNTNLVFHRFVTPTKGTSGVTSLAASLLALGTFGGVYTLLNTVLPNDGAEAEAEAKESLNNPILDLIDSFVNPQTAAPRSQFQPNAHHHPHNVQY